MLEENAPIVGVHVGERDVVERLRLGRVFLDQRRLGRARLERLEERLDDLLLFLGHVPVRPRHDDERLENGHVLLVHGRHYRAPKGSTSTGVRGTDKTGPSPAKSRELAKARGQGVLEVRRSRATPDGEADLPRGDGRFC